MKVETAGRLTRVELTRRNLRALLHKLDVEDSARALLKPTPEGRTLAVVAVEDEAHYGDRDPGRMSDETEEFLNG